MPSLPESVYRLTPKDETGLLLEPYFRSTTIVLAATEGSRFVLFNTPVDRCLLLNELVVDLEQDSTTIWGRIRLAALNQQNTVRQVVWGIGGTSGIPNIVPPNVAVGAATNIGGIVSHSLDLLFPPGAQPEWDVQRFGTITNPVAVRLSVSGYLVPTGTVARGL